MRVKQLQQIRHRYHYCNFYSDDYRKWYMSGDQVICRCKRGYGSELDGLCSGCRGISVHGGYDMIMAHLAKLPREQVNPKVDFSLWNPPV